MPYLTLMAELNPKKVFYTVQKRQSEFHLLLIHGAGGSHLTWPPSLRRRLTGATVWALDLPGHGRSDPPGENDIDQYARFISSFVSTQELDRKKVVLAGHSMGGAIALAIARQRPAWLHGLILIGTGAEMRVNPELFEMIAQDLPAYADFFSRYAWSRTADPELVARTKADLLAQPAAVLLGDYTACSRFDLRAELAHIDLPTLVIGGEKDRFMPPSFSEALAAGLPNAALQILPAAGHMMILEQPEAVAGLVSDFIEQL